MRLEGDVAPQGHRARSGGSGSRCAPGVAAPRSALRGVGLQAPRRGDRAKDAGPRAPGPGEQWSGEGQRPRRRLVQAQRLLPATLAPSRETERELGGGLAQNGGNSDNDRASPNRIFLKSDTFKTLGRAAPTGGQQRLTPVSRAQASSESSSARSPGKHRPADFKYSRVTVVIVRVTPTAPHGHTPFPRGSVGHRPGTSRERLGSYSPG